MSPRDTRGRIVDAALELFNARGSAAVSTNHIAEEAGISPGNLYYHFGNKEEIVRAIWERMVAHMDDAWVPGAAPSPATLRHAFVRGQLLLWDYRFFYREMNALLQRDPELKRTVRELRARRLVEMERFYLALRDAGVLRFPDTPDATQRLRDLLRIGWLISDYWLAFIDIDDRDLDEAAAAEGFRHLWRLIEPYLSDDARAELAPDVDSATPSRPRPAAPVPGPGKDPS